MRLRNGVAVFSIVNLVTCLLDVWTNEAPCLDPCCQLTERVQSLRLFLVLVYQLANLLLLLATIVEISFLVQLFLWYTLSFVVIGFALSVVEFVFRFQHKGGWSLFGLVMDVVYLSVLFKCLPLVDIYKRHLERRTVNST